MLHIILLIFKIIGIVALVLLGLLLTILLIIFLVPVRYRVSGSYHGKPQGVAKITWLLHIVSVTASYEEDFMVSVRIFGFPVMKPVVEDGEEAEDFVVQAMETTIEDGEKRARDILDGEKSEKTAGSSPNNVGNSAEEKQEKKTEEMRFGKAKRGADSSEKKGLSKLKLSFSHIIDRLKNTSENIAAKKDGVQEWITNEENKKTFRLLFRQAKKLFFHILPRKGKGNVVFGFDDPYITGQVLTYLSVVYPFCHRQLEFLPIFDSDGLVLEADGNFRGRIRLGTLFAIAARVLLNKNFRVILKRWMR